MAMQNSHRTHVAVHVHVSLPLECVHTFVLAVDVKKALGLVGIARMGELLSRDIYMYAFFGVPTCFIRLMLSGASCCVHYTFSLDVYV